MPERPQKEQAWGTECGHSSFKKVEAGGKGLRPRFVHSSSEVDSQALWGKYSSMYQSQSVSKTLQSVPAFCSSGNDWEVLLVGTVLIISDRMELEIA